MGDWVIRAAPVNAGAALLTGMEGWRVGRVSRVAGAGAMA